MCLMLLNLPLQILELPHSILVGLGKVAKQNIAVYGGALSFVTLL